MTAASRATVVPAKRAYLAAFKILQPRRIVLSLFHTPPGSPTEFSK
jgi:hypothetical protein